MRTRGIAFVVATCLLVTASTLSAGKWPWSTPLAPPQQPHPAVVRVSVVEADGTSHGSGSLIDVREQFGLVITNWHVVRDASGPINVVFPDGFRSAARVLRVDRDWDLAALLIWRPRATPIPLAVQAPRPGDLLTIAGYGAGNYRTVTGRCTQYVAPSEQHPFEMVELAVTARQGDSGGPIFNAAGELAGVLFGSGGGTTSGSYAGRVRQFVATAWLHGPQTDLPKAAPTQTLATAPPDTTSRSSSTRLTTGSPVTGNAIDRVAQPPEIARMTPLPKIRRLPAPSASTSSLPSPVLPSAPGATRHPLAPAEATATPDSTSSWQSLAGNNAYEQGKTFLAILGSITLVYQFARFLAPRPS